MRWPYDHMKVTGDNPHVWLRRVFDVGWSSMAVRSQGTRLVTDRRIPTVNVCVMSQVEDVLGSRMADAVAVSATKRASRQLKRDRLGDGVRDALDPRVDRQ